MLPSNLCRSDKELLGFCFAVMMEWAMAPSQQCYSEKRAQWKDFFPQPIPLLHITHMFSDSLFSYIKIHSPSLFWEISQSCGILLSDWSISPPSLAFDIFRIGLGKRKKVCVISASCQDWEVSITVVDERVILEVTEITATHHSHENWEYQIFT